LKSKSKSKMKRDKIIYWATTGLVAAGMAMSAFMYLSNNPELMKSFETLGIPKYLVIVLGIAKLLGSVALLAPVWDRLKEWAYAGFTFVFIGATWTHVATGTPWIAPLIALLILITSYTFRMKLSNSNEKQSALTRASAEVQVN
jgi:uncharacterized membrane protein YphA (DoxX/SURF4 family)